MMKKKCISCDKREQENVTFKIKKMKIIAFMRSESRIDKIIIIIIIIMMMLLLMMINQHEWKLGGKGYCMECLHI